MPVPDTLPWDERLILEEPALPEDDDRGLHALLHTVFSSTKTQLPRLIAMVRTQLRLLPAEMADRAKLSTFRYVAAEQDASGPKSMLDRYASILEAWRLFGVSVGIREQLLEMLAPDTSMQAFYTRAGAELGPDNVRQRIPGIWTTLQQRRNAPEDVPKPVPSFRQVAEHLDALYPLPADATADTESHQRVLRRRAFARQAWEHDGNDHYVARQLESPLSRALLLLERTLWEQYGEELTLDVLRSRCGLTFPAARGLLNGEIVDTNVMRDVFSRLRATPSDGWDVEWQAVVDAEDARLSFSRRYKQVLAAGSISLPDVGAWLDVKSKRTPDSGTSRFRPDLAVRSVLDDNANVAGLAPAAMIAVGTSDEAQRAALQRAYCQERERHYIRSGSWLRGVGLHARVQRELAGEGASLQGTVSRYNDGMRSGHITSRNIQLFEERRKKHGIDQDRLFDVLGDIAQERVDTALSRKAAAEVALLGDDTVRGFVAAAVLRHNGATSIAEAMNETAEDSAVSMNPRDILDVAEGKAVPTLPVLRHFAAAVGCEELPPALVQQWIAAYPLWLRDRGEQAMRHPLARVLATMVARVEAGSVRSFYDHRYLAGAPSQASMYAQRFFAGEEDTLSLHIAVNTALAAGYEEDSVPVLLVQHLHAQQGDIVSAVTQLREQAGLSPEQYVPGVLIGLTEDECLALRSST